MKSILAAIVFAAVPAFAENVTGPAGERLGAWPTRIEVPGGVITPVSRATAEASGYHESTAEELAAWAEEDAAAAALVGPEPETIVPMLDAGGNPVGTARIIVDTNLQIVAVINSASPQKTWAEQRAAYEAKAAAREARMQAARKAKSNGNLQQRIAALEDLLEVK